MKIIELLQLDPMYYAVAGGGVVVVMILIFLIRYLIRRSRFISEFREIMEQEGQLHADIERFIYKKTGLVSRLLSGMDPEKARSLLYRTGIADRWVSRSWKF